jgi:iron complex outermembrane receptor protein
MRTQRYLPVVVLLALAVAAAPLSAQDTGSIEGRVASSTEGHGLAGVVVTVGDTGLSQVSDHNGLFSFTDVPAGTYTLNFSLGEESASREGVVVEAGQTARVDVTYDWDVSFAETITVFSASRRPERITEAPAAVTVVSEEEIERQAATGQIPKLLEFTPGAEVTQSGVYDYNFNTRGFNSSLNRRVATLVDGRDPSVPFLGAQEWAAVGFPMDDLASVELLRGPSAALYGANAASGVLNLTTKQPRYSQGGLVRLTAGELSTTNVDFRWAADLSSDWYAKVVGGLRDSGDFTQPRTGTLAEYSRPCPVANAPDCLPRELAAPSAQATDDEILFGSARVDKYFSDSAFLTFEGGASQFSGPVFQTGIGRVQLVDIERLWGRLNFSSRHWNVLLYQNNRDAAKQLALASGANVVLDEENRQAEVQTNWDFSGGKGRIVLGGSYAEDDISTFDPLRRVHTLMTGPVDTDFTAAYGQFDWRVSRLRFVLAGRFDDSSLHDSQFSPKAAAVWSVSPNHTLRLTYNEAFQVPNYSEFFLFAPAGVTSLAAVQAGVCTPLGLTCFSPTTVAITAFGNPNLELEEVKTVEVGWNGIFATKAFVTLDYYNSQNQNFVTDLLPLGTAGLGRFNTTIPLWTAPAGVPAPVANGIRNAVPALTTLPNGSPAIAVSYTNFGDVDTQGIDFGLNYYLNRAWTLAASYSWFDFEIQGDTRGLERVLLPNSPENKATLGLTWAGQRFDANTSWRWSDDFRWSVGPFQGDVPSYNVVDLAGNYHLSDRVTIGAHVSNVLDDEHWEAFGGDLISRRALGYVTFSWE